MEDLASLRRALDELEAMEPIDQARAIPALRELADRVLMLRRGAAFEALAGPGRPMKIPELAVLLGVHRSRVDEALKAYRSARQDG
jgi:hypothetical protein